MSGEVSFYSNVMNMLKSYDLSYEDLEPINNTKLTHIVNKMKDKYK